MNDALTPGDPLIVEHEKKIKLCIIIKLFDCDHSKEFVNLKDLEKLSVTVKVRELKLKEVNNDLFSTGEYTSEVLSVSGRNCMTVKPAISLDPPEGCAIYFFDKQMIQDIGVHLTLIEANQPSSSWAMPQFSSSSSLSSNVSATGSDAKLVLGKVCKKKKVPLKDMRTHMGRHIALNDIGLNENTCGFCGQEGCRSYLSNSSLSKNKAFYSPMSDCIYFYAYKKVGKKATRYTRCTNRITTCPLCNLYIWWYNLVPHYLNVHPAEDIDSISIPKEEIELLKKI